MEFGRSTTITARLEGPFGSNGTSVKMGTVFLSASGWKGAESPYHQTVELEGVSVNSRVDLLPDLQQLQILREGSVALMAENEDGIVTVWAIGAKTAEDMTLQAAILEVTA